MSEYTVIGMVVAAFIAAGVLSYLFTPPVKRFAQKIGAIDVPKDNRRMHKQPAAGRSGDLRRLPVLDSGVRPAGPDHAVRAARGDDHRRAGHL